MHLSVLILTFFLTVSSFAFAQDRSVDRYTPPPMFGGPEPDEAPALPETRPPSNLDLINLDSISGRSHNSSPSETRAALLPAPSKAFKPPLPPRRPSTFHVSQNYLDRITAPQIAIPSRPRQSAPVISPPALAADSLNADLLAMDVMDIYENLVGKAELKKSFINVPPLPLRVERAGPDRFQLSFTDDSASLTEAHAIKIDEELLPSLEAGFASIAIEAPTPHDMDRQQHRLALSRAIAIRNYLELNGIERDQILIEQIRQSEVPSGKNTISIRLLE